MVLMAGVVAIAGVAVAAVAVPAPLVAKAAVVAAVVMPARVGVPGNARRWKAAGEGERHGVSPDEQAQPCEGRRHSSTHTHPRRASSV